MYGRHSGKSTAIDTIKTGEVVPHHRYPLRPQDRLRPLAALALGLLIAAVILLFLQVKGFLNHLEARPELPAGDGRLQVLDQQMQSLRSRFNGLLAESVENRLRILQNNLDKGVISAEDLRIFAELQRDLSLLEHYSGTGVAVPGSASLEHDRYQPAPTPAVTHRAGNEQLVGEVRELKVLLLICTTLLIVAGMLSAFHHARRHRSLPRSEPPLPPATLRIPDQDDA